MSISRFGVREDRRTGQFVPTVDGHDVSPTSFDRERALEIAAEAVRPDVTKCARLLRENQALRQAMRRLISDHDDGLSFEIVWNEARAALAQCEKEGSK